MDQDLFCYLESKSEYGRGGMNSEFGLETKTESSVADIIPINTWKFTLKVILTVPPPIFKGWKYMG